MSWKLRALSLINRLVKYADDMTLVVPQHTDCLIEEELKNIVNWAENNKQNINTNKTKEIIFWKAGKPCKAINIPLIPQIERVQQVTLLGVQSIQSINPIYRSHHILNKFWLYPHSDSIRWTNWKKCHSHLPDLATYLGHWLFHAFHMLYLLLRVHSEKWRWSYQRYVQEGQPMGHYNWWTGPSIHCCWLWLVQHFEIKFENHCRHHLLPKVHEVVSYNLRGRPTRYDLPKVTFTKLLNSSYIAVPN